MNLQWREQELYYGELFVGSVSEWKHGQFTKKHWKVMIMTCAQGESLGLVATENDGRERLEIAARCLLKLYL